MAFTLAVIANDVVARYRRTGTTAHRRDPSRQSPSAPYVVVRMPEMGTCTDAVARQNSHTECKSEHPARAARAPNQRRLK
jgi:hypothetical protein